MQDVMHQHLVNCLKKQASKEDRENGDLLYLHFSCKERFDFNLCADVPEKYVRGALSGSVAAMHVYKFHDVYDLQLIITITADNNSQQKNCSLGGII